MGFTESGYEKAPANTRAYINLIKLKIVLSDFHNSKRYIT